MNLESAGASGAPPPSASPTTTPPASTINDVARRAGVSISTVSRTFATPDRVRQATRERVLSVARELDYTPSRVASSLAGGRTGALGLIVPDIANPFFANIVKSIQGRARQKAYAVFLADTDEHEDEEYDLATTIARQVDGLVLASPRMSDDELADIVARTPTVLVNRSYTDVASVVATTVDGMRQAIEHLHALGHTRCGYVSGPRNSWSNTRRADGVRLGCSEFGVELHELGPFEAKFDAGVRAADLAVAAEVTALVAYNDLVALGVMARLAQRGVTVPDDLSVIGVDDTLLAATSNPALTTVRVPFDDFGRRAVDMLLQLLNTPEYRSRDAVELSAGLIVRASTGPANPPTSR